MFLFHTSGMWVDQYFPGMFLDYILSTKVCKSGFGKFQLDILNSEFHLNCFGRFHQNNIHTYFGHFCSGMSQVCTLNTDFDHYLFGRFPLYNLNTEFGPLCFDKYQECILGSYLDHCYFDKFLRDSFYTHYNEQIYSIQKHQY